MSVSVHLLNSCIDLSYARKRFAKLRSEHERKARFRNVLAHLKSLEISRMRLPHCLSLPYSDELNRFGSNHIKVIPTSCQRKKFTR